MSVCWFWHSTIIQQIKFRVYCLCFIFTYVDIAISKHTNFLIRNKNDYKYQTKIQITENSHLTLVCPEIEKESHVQWFKDDELLNSSFSNNIDYGEEEPHITIDSYNSLYILNATKYEEGIYACKVDGDIIQQCFVIIVSKSSLLNQDFIRFSIYLGFVLSLTLLCYCAGISLAWHRRASFADPLNLYK